MKGLLIWLFLALISFNLAAAQEKKWQAEKSTHFIIHYKSSSEDFIRQLAEKSEVYYNKIAEDLGFIRFNFWLWDNRAHIYVYDDAKDYQVATGQPEWSAGSAVPGHKAIYTYSGSQNFFATVLPHEMGHIIFREFVGFNNPAVPIWLDEAVASYQMDVQKASADPAVKQAIQNESFMSIEELSGYNPLLMKDEARVSLFYLEAISILNYLIKEFGKDSFVLFCQNLRDKRDLDRAFASAYPFENIRQLDQSWQEHLNR
jgi:hypothetical protein